MIDFVLTPHANVFVCIILVNLLVSHDRDKLFAIVVSILASCSEFVAITFFAIKKKRFYLLSFFKLLILTFAFDFDLNSKCLLICLFPLKLFLV